MSLSLTVQSSSGPNWYDAPLAACFEAVEKGSFVGKGSGKVTIKFLDYSTNFSNPSECNFAFRNYIYDEKEFSLSRSLESCGIFTDNNLYVDADKGFAFCEYTEFKADSSVKPIH
tara:strand:- start:150 stop:494 length:345 start_codon:yes stop_codon:yes gene_type:complete